VSKIEKIQESIVKDKFTGDPLDGVTKKAQRLGIKKNEFALQTVSKQEVIRAIKKTKGSKCADIFGIAPVVLKLAPDVLAMPLTWLINNIIKEGVIPQAWNEGRVLPHHKKNEKSKVENYRPVCILPSPNKIKEEVVGA
jgi:hypothetical protein